MIDTLRENTVQSTLCIPLWGRMLAARAYPQLFPDRDAERVVRAIGCDLSGSRLFRSEFAWLNAAVRQYDLACEIKAYLKIHPHAVVVEMGAGLSALRRQMGVANPWVGLDMPEVIALRETYLPAGENERNVACDLNDPSWFDAVGFRPEDGIVFVAGGLFYYFTTEQVRSLLCAMAARFPGGAAAFDATNRMGLRGVNKEVRMAGNRTRSFFSLEHPEEELEAWSDRITGVSEKDYMRGYLGETKQFRAATRLTMRLITWTHLSFIVHAEFR